ncbi:MAG: aryl-sulfate sulfotransferase [Myxococcota bacterium]
MWLAIVGCIATSSPNEEPPEQTRPVVAPGLEIATERVPNELALLARVTSTIERTVGFVARNGDTVLETPAWTVAADRPTELPILGLFPGDWTITARVDGEDDGQWSLTTVKPSPFVDSPTNDFVGGWPESEAICAAREQRSPAYTCTNRRGEPNFFVEMPFQTMFVRPLADGTLLAHPDGPDQLFHFDRLGREIRTLDFEDLLPGTRFDHVGIDEHESIEIVEGPWTGAWAVLTYTADDDIEKTGAGIIVYDPAEREVLWDWSAHGTPGDGVSVDPERLPYDRWGVDEYGEDWLHANALVHGTDADGDFFWMSLRHQDWIIEIRAPDGAITMQLGRGGDVTLTDGSDPDWFYHQHAPELRRRSDREFEVLVFDNGNERPGVEEPRTRIVEYLVDREAKIATRLRDFETAYFAAAAGDADRMPSGDHVLVTRAVGDPFVAELGIAPGVDVEAERRWVQAIPREGEVYRAEFFPSLYETGWSATTGW